MTTLSNNKFRRYFKQPRRAALGVALLVFALALLVLWRFGIWYEAQLLTNKRATVAAQLAPYGNALTTTINRRFALLQGLAAFAQAEIDSPAEDLGAEFETFAAGLYTGAPGIRNFSIAPGGVQGHVYPLEGNENVLGHDLLHDQRLNVRADVQRAIETRVIALSGPYELRQGGLGLVARQAIYQDGDFWGLAAMVLDMPPVLAEAGLDDVGLNLAFALRDDAGAVFFGDGALFEDDPVIYAVELPEGKWELAAVPIAGWQVAMTSSFLLVQGGGLFVALLVMALTYLLVSRQARLDSAIEQKKQELSGAFQELQASETSASSVEP